MADYESMTPDELVDANVALKAQINALRAEQAIVADVHRRKHMQALAEQALANAGVQGVSITPEPATLAADMHTPGGVE